MTSRKVPLLHGTGAACIALVLALLVLAGGCTQEQAPSPVPVPETTVLITDTPTPVPTIPVAVKVKKTDNSNIRITFDGGGERGQLMELDATVTDSRGRATTQHLGDRLGTSPVTIGSVITFTGSYAGTTNVFISGYYSDGSSRNILETQV